MTYTLVKELFLKIFEPLYDEFGGNGNRYHVLTEKQGFLGFGARRDFLVFVDEPIVADSRGKIIHKLREIGGELECDLSSNIFMKSDFYRRCRSHWYTLIIVARTSAIVRKGTQIVFWTPRCADRIIFYIINDETQTITTGLRAFPPPFEKRNPHILKMNEIVHFAFPDVKIICKKPW